MNCKDCPFCLIEKNEKTWQTFVRCRLCPTPRTKGKPLYWSMDTCNFDKSERKTGAENCQEYLSKRKSAPSWCPIKKAQQEEMIFGVKICSDIKSEYIKKQLEIYQDIIKKRG
jgi:hypothetical protein